MSDFFQSLLHTFNNYAEIAFFVFIDCIVVDTENKNKLAALGAHCSHNGHSQHSYIVVVS